MTPRGETERAQDACNTRPAQKLRSKSHVPHEILGIQPEEGTRNGSLFHSAAHGPANLFDFLFLLDELVVVRGSLVLCLLPEEETD